MKSPKNRPAQRIALLCVVLLGAVGLLWLALGWDRSVGARLARAGPGVASARASAPAELAAVAPTAQEAPPPVAPVEASPARVAAQANEADAFEAAELAPMSRGRLVDRATLEPVAEALVTTGAKNAWSDANGWFDTGEALDELEELLVVNVTTDTLVHHVPRVRWTRRAGGWQIPLSLGPTYRLRAGPVTDEPIELEGRLAWEGSDETWLRLRPGPPPYLRYDMLVVESIQAHKPWLELRSQDGRIDGRAAVPGFTGIQTVDAVWRERALLRGRVVDESGAPWSELLVRAVHASTGGVECLEVETQRDGSYVLSASQPGDMQVAVLPTTHAAPARFRLRLPGGVSSAPDVVFARTPQNAALSGSVRFVSGKRKVDVTLRLRALDGSAFERVTKVGLGTSDVNVEWRLRSGARVQTLVVEDGEDAAGGVSVPVPSSVFVFDDLAPGRYELSVLSEPAFPWSPARLEVVAPTEGIVLSCDDRAPLSAYHLRVIDASSGASLEDLMATVTRKGGEPVRRRVVEGEPLIECLEGESFTWSVVDRTHRPARGTERDFERLGDTWLARCSLQPGFSASLFVRDWTSPALRSRAPAASPAGLTNSAGLADAVIFADGARVGTTDAHGRAEIELDAEPERLEARLAGWRMLDRPESLLRPSERRPVGRLRFDDTLELRMARE